MSIGREYYDEEGNYWQIETPYYIPPKEAIKHPEYVKGCITAEERRRAEQNAEKYRRYNRNLFRAYLVVVAILAIAVVVKRFVV